MAQIVEEGNQINTFTAIATIIVFNLFYYQVGGNEISVLTSRFTHVRSQFKQICGILTHMKFVCRGSETQHIDVRI